MALSRYWLVGASCAAIAFGSVLWAAGTTPQHEAPTPRPTAAIPTDEPIPLLPKDNEGRVKLDLERVQYWLGQGAQATDRVQRFLEAAGVAEQKARSNPKQGQPGKAAQERAKARADKAAAAEAPAE